MTALQDTISHITKYAISLLLSLPVAAIGWAALFRGSDIADERYLTARLSFFILALACALLMAAYGIAGIGRNRGWFHRHPAATDARIGMWRAVSEELETHLQAGTLRGYALTQDGALHPVPAEILTPELIRTAVRGADRDALWAALRRRLRLRNAPAGRFVIDRADIMRHIGDENPCRGFRADGGMG